MLMVSTSALSQAPALTFGLIGDLGYVLNRGVGRPALRRHPILLMSGQRGTFVHRPRDFGNRGGVVVADLVGERVAELISWPPAPAR